MIIAVISRPLDERQPYSPEPNSEFKKIGSLSGRSSQLCIRSDARFLGIGPRIAGSPASRDQGSLRPKESVQRSRSRRGMTRAASLWTMSGQTTLSRDGNWFHAVKAARELAIGGGGVVLACEGGADLFV